MSSSSLSPSSLPSEITLLEKLDLLPAVLQSLGQTIASAASYPFMGEPKLQTFKRHVFVTLMRRVFERLSIGQVHFLIGTTPSNFTTWAKSQNRPVAPVEIPAAATKAYWIGDPTTASTLLLYVHGGGFIMASGPGHYEFVARIVEYANSNSNSNASHVSASASSSSSTSSPSSSPSKKKKKQIAALFLQYDTAPQHRAPHQLQQCVEFVRYAMDVLGYSPARIILGGESAGAALVLGVLSHVLHPHEGIEPLELREALRGVVLCNPGVRFDSLAGSERARRHECCEPLGPGMLYAWTRQYLPEGGEGEGKGTGKGDAWSEPGRNATEWWKGLDTIVKRVLVTSAKEEVMAVDVEDLVGKIKTIHNKVTYLSVHAEFHAEPVIGILMHLEECESSKLIKAWVREQMEE